MSDSSAKLFEDLPIGTLFQILDALPVDVSFVDEQDTVTYFNLPAEGRIFPRAKTDIGRKVQRCHPPRSLHLVNQVLEELRSGQKSSVDFWIQRQGRMVSIRYFPVRDAEGNYLGTLEVTQDVTEIRKLEGEKRLMDPAEGD
ncbi:MAG: PAS domain-containing protein [Firmicutes bacterium]|nr:PAS domain-containing protein [Bacillota bacterium]